MSLPESHGVSDKAAACNPWGPAGLNPALSKYFSPLAHQVVVRKIEPEVMDDNFFHFQVESSKEIPSHIVATK